MSDHIEKAMEMLQEHRDDIDAALRALGRLGQPSVIVNAPKPSLSKPSAPAIVPPEDPPVPPKKKNFTNRDQIAGILEVAKRPLTPFSIKRLLEQELVIVAERIIKGHLVADARFSETAHGLWVLAGK